MEIFTIVKDYIYRRLQHIVKIEIQSLYTNEFPFPSSMPPSWGDKVTLENGTVQTDKVVMVNLKFWLPSTKAHPIKSST